uniref:Pyruvate kinase n=1 Tax=candidate division WOR-3 bacterium TaxID=2052148 RepID=A0A7V4E5A3_UNCW3
MKLTKIIATVGPSISAESLMERLIKSGVNALRFNFSHGTYDEHSKKIKWAKNLQNKGYNFAVFVDLSGPKFRIGEVTGDRVVLKRGDEFVLTTEKIIGNNRTVYAPLEGVIPYLKKGDTVLLSDGTVELKVKKITKNSVITKVIMGGEISSHKGINIPNRMHGISAITEKDIQDMRFAISLGVRIFAISFVGGKEDVIRAREVLKQEGVNGFIIAKIERFEAVANFDEILDVADGIMIARGDLAVETPYAKVPILQKELILKTREKGKVVIIATQMLRSLLFSPLPSRAEISDIANAVLDGSDALMLSEETAVAKNPLNSVRVMKEIIKEAERFRKKKGEGLPLNLKEKENIEWQIARSSFELWKSLRARLIITPTASGATALRISALRPLAPIVAPTPDPGVCEFLNLSFGIYPLKVDVMRNLDELIYKVKDEIFKRRLAKEGDLAVITAGYPFGKPGSTNMVKVEKL